MGGGSGRGLSFGATIGSGELPLQYKVEPMMPPKQLNGSAEAATRSSEDKNPQMLVRYMGGATGAHLIIGKLYEVLAIECDQYRIVDETKEESLYPQELFEVVKTNNKL